MKNTILILAIALTIGAQAQIDNSRQYQCAQNANILKFWEGSAISMGTNAMVLKLTKRPGVATISALAASFIGGSVIKLSGRANNYQSGLFVFGGVTGTMYFTIGRMVRKSYLRDKGMYQFR